MAASSGVASTGAELSTESRSPHLLDPWSDEPPVVVSGNDKQLPVWPQPPSERAQYRLGHRQGFVGLALREFDHVAKQDQPLDVGERLEQDAERRAAPQDIPFQAHAEVQVGDDQSAHSA